MTTLTNDLPFLSSLECAAAVSCSPIGPGLGGVKMGLGSTGKLGRAWVVHGAWHGDGGCHKNEFPFHGAAHT